MMRKKESFFRPSKKKVLVFLILFYFAFMFFPLIKCIDSENVKQNFCEAYHECKVDVYFPLANIVSSYEDGHFFCPATRISLLGGTAIVAFIIAFTYAIACLLNYYYRKYRDV